MLSFYKEKINKFYWKFFRKQVPPRWIVEPQDQSAILGNTVLITCKSDGFPVPTVHWKQAIGKCVDYTNKLGNYLVIKMSWGHF